MPLGVMTNRPPVTRALTLPQVRATSPAARSLRPASTTSSLASFSVYAMAYPSNGPQLDSTRSNRESTSSTISSV